MLSYSFYMALVILSLLLLAKRLFPFALVVRLALVVLEVTGGKQSLLLLARKHARDTNDREKEMKSNISM